MDQTSFYIKQLAVKFEGQLTWLRKNTEKHINFLV